MDINSLFEPTITLRKLYFHFFSHWMGYDWDDSFPFNFEPNGIPFGSKLKGKLSPRSYPIQCERNWITSFLSALNTFLVTLSEPCARSDYKTSGWRTPWKPLRKIMAIWHQGVMKMGEGGFSWAPWACNWEVWAFRAANDENCSQVGRHDWLSYELSYLPLDNTNSLIEKHKKIMYIVKDTRRYLDDTRAYYHTLEKM